MHNVSVANPVPVPETRVPVGPDVGVSVKVPGRPSVTAKVAVADSPGTSVVIVTI